jgi:glutamyl-tRNA synthetase
LINLFAIENINRAPAAFNLDKLLWLNQHYLKTSNSQHVLDELAWHMEKQGIDISHGPALGDILKAQCERTKTLKEMAERSRYFYADVPLTAEMQAVVTTDIVPALLEVRDHLATLGEWSKDAIHAVLAAAAEAKGLKMGKVAQPLRVLMTGGTVSPPIDLTIELIGRDRALKRIDQALKLVDKVRDAS